MPRSVTSLPSRPHICSTITSTIAIRFCYRGPGFLISIRSKCSCCNCKPISPTHESDDHDIKVFYVPLPVSPSASDKGLVKDKMGNELVKPLISNKSVRAVPEIALMAGVLLCVAVFARGVKFGPFKLTVLALKKFK